ncbi:MAG: DUF1150 domain-containing protein [Alphaproteobacteria bacterium]|nr:DUF1150 domain-containing protein [Alphaproteobacteria bacterium]
MTPEALARLGTDEKIVYVRPVTARELEGKVQGIGELAGDTVLYAVHAADGTPMAVVEDRATAFAAARQYEMEPVSVH